MGFPYFFQFLHCVFHFMLLFWFVGFFKESTFLDFLKKKKKRLFINIQKRILILFFSLVGSFSFFKKIDSLYWNLTFCLNILVGFSFFVRFGLWGFEEWAFLDFYMKRNGKKEEDGWFVFLDWVTLLFCCKLGKLKVPQLSVYAMIISCISLNLEIVCFLI